MFKRVRHFGRELLSNLPKWAQESYFKYRTSRTPLHKFVRYYEESEILSLLPYRPKTIVDIGANHGNWTWGLLQLLGANADFYLFEPTPILYREISARFASYPNVWVYDRAISNRKGTVDFFVTEDDVMSSLEQLDTGAFPVRHSKHSHWFSVTLDNVHREILQGRQIDLLKVDTQGHEEAILEFSNTVLLATRAVLVEWSIVPIYRNDSDFISLHRLLCARGFQLSQIFNRPLENHKLTWVDALYLNPSLIS